MRFSKKIGFACAPLLLLELLVALPQSGGSSSSAGSIPPSYAGQVLLPTAHSNLRRVMARPFEVIRFSRRSAGLGFLNVSST